MSHVAMSGYNTMNRMVKFYKFAYGNSNQKKLSYVFKKLIDPKDIPGHTISFSGYPAALASADDFTLTSAGLVG